MDYSALLYDPVYAAFGVPATMTVAGAGEVALTVVDHVRAKSNVTAASSNVEARSVEAAAFARIPELIANGIYREDYRGSILTFNGRTWSVRSHDLRGSPNGEDFGEVRFLLKPAEEGPLPPVTYNVTLAEAAIANFVLTGVVTSGGVVLTGDMAEAATADLVADATTDTNATSIEAATADLVVDASVISGTVTDTFNRANGSLGANWTSSPALAAAGGGSLVISANAVISSPASNFFASYYNAASFSNDQYAQIVISGGGGIGAGVVVRHQAAASSFYAFFANTNGDAYYFRYDNGAINILHTFSGQAVPSGATIKLRVIGSTLTASVNGVDLASQTDTTYTGGSPGIICYTAIADSFQAGPS